jgi:signal recognition particle GTPase
MFESLSEKLEGALKDVKGQGRINELNIAETMREIRVRSSTPTSTTRSRATSPSA